MTRRQTQNNPLEQPHHWWHRIGVSSQKFAILLVVTTFLSGFGYVLLTNKTASEGFAIKQLQNNIADLQTQNEKLQIQAADLQSLAVADQAASKMNLKPVDAFQVLPSGTGSVAFSR